METLMRRNMARFIVICLMAVLSTKSIVESRNMPNNEDKIPMKKIYPYVSEYKRLPLYNFGIGKRFSDGNNMRMAQPYSFGFGKRSIQVPALLGKKPDVELYGNGGGPQSPDNEKRGGSRGSSRYDFGIGKRSLPFPYEAQNIAADRDAMEAELRQHFNDNLEQRLFYGLSNKFAIDPNDDRDED